MIDLVKNPELNCQEDYLAEIERLDNELLQHFHDKFVIDSSLNRQLVSFQANKELPGYRWYKFKEAFSASLGVCPSNFSF